MVEAQQWLSQSALCSLAAHPLRFHMSLDTSFYSKKGEKNSKIISVLTSPGAICGQEAVASLAGQPRPAGASGSGHVDPNVSHSDQLPQHQTDHSCVTRQEQAHNLHRIRGSGLNPSVPYKHELIYRADSGPRSVFV